MKIEKEVYIGNVYYTECLDKKYHLNFNCIVYNCLNEKEKETFNKLQEKTKIKLTLEAEDPILVLDDAERKYLSDVIRPFKDKVAFIKKLCCWGNFDYEYIRIYFRGDDSMLFPAFKKNTMYKRMKLNKGYTLKELGL